MKEAWRRPAGNVAHRLSIGTALTRNGVDSVCRSGAVGSHKRALPMNQFVIYKLVRRALYAFCFLLV